MLNSRGDYGVAYANAHWTWKADLSNTVAANTQLEHGKAYYIQNNATSGVYLGWGVDGTAANLESATGKGRFLDAGREIYVVVTDSRLTFLSALPISGTSAVRILEVKTPV